MKAIHIIVTGLVVVNIFLTRELLLKVPTIWSDEAAFAHIAENVLKENRPHVDLYGEMYPGFKEFIGGQTPLFYYLLAAWFKSVGISVEKQRILSVIAATLFLLTLYFLNKLFLKNPGAKLPNRNSWMWGLVVGGLLLDAFFLPATRISRQEIFILLFGALSFYFYLRSFLHLSSKELLLFILLSGFFASLGFLTHVIAIFIAGSILFHMLLVERLNILKSKSFYIFLLGFLVPILIWIASSLNRLSLIQQQISLNVSVKNAQSAWLLSVFQGEVLSHKLLFGGHLLISVVFIVFLLVYLFRHKSSSDETVKLNKKKYLLLGIFLVFSWVFANYGKMLWYFVYPIPFVYMAITVLLLETQTQELWSKNSSTRWSLSLLQGVFLLIIGTNIYINYNIAAPLIGQKYSYHKLGQKVLSAVPEKKSVFLASSPDLYYSFKKRGQNQLYEFPPFYAEKEKYFELLNKADYIVRSEPWTDLIFGDFLPNYISKNSAQIYKTTEPFEYEVFIIELKPVSQRVYPK